MSPRRNIEEQQPPKATRAPRRPKKTKSKGSLTNPYKRARDGEEIVRLTVWLSKACALQYKRHTLTLKAEDDTEINEWLEELIYHGINSGFMRKRKGDSAPPVSAPLAPVIEHEESGFVESYVQREDG